MRNLSVIRPINLIIIALNIAIVDFFISQGTDWNMSRVSILILKITAMVLLAAGGNVINDYFDQKTDAINRPQKQVVGKSMSPKNAIRLHLALTSSAIASAFFLTIIEQRLFYVIIALIYTVVLYFYTPFLKRLPILGNLTIACCIAFLPIWSVDGWPMLSDFQRATVLWLVAFAFLSNLIREWVKDVQDGEGDRNQGYHTAPVRWGLENSVQILQGMWWMLTALAFAYCYLHQSWWSWLCVLFPQILGWFPLWIAKSGRDMQRISWILKFNMVIGMMGILINFLLLSGS
jgi:4-hydroxybenzoate polyprenyltransferase